MYSLSSATSWDLCPRQFLSGDDPAPNKSDPPKKRSSPSRTADHVEGVCFMGQCGRSGSRRCHYGRFGTNNRKTAVIAALIRLTSPPTPYPPPPACLQASCYCVQDRWPPVIVWLDSDDGSMSLSGVCTELIDSNRHVVPSVGCLP